MSADLLDTFGRPVVAITGVGVVTSLGRGVEENWTALTQGRSGIHRITRFPTDNLRTTCLLYTSPSPRDRQKSRMPSSA